MKKEEKKGKNNIYNSKCANSVWEGYFKFSGSLY